MHSRNNKHAVHTISISVGSSSLYYYLCILFKELHHVEMAHRTKETPAGLQYENNAPNQYFYELLESFDNRMTLYKKLIEDTEGYLVCAQQGTAITPKGNFYSGFLFFYFIIVAAFCL